MTYSNAGEAQLWLGPGPADIGEELQSQLLLHTQIGARKPMQLTVEANKATGQLEVRIHANLPTLAAVVHATVDGHGMPVLDTFV